VGVILHIASNITLTFKILQPTMLLPIPSLLVVASLLAQEASAGPVRPEADDIVKRDSGWYASCNRAGLYQRMKASPDKNSMAIGANCREKSGIYNVDTSVNINQCTTNKNGKLEAKKKYAQMSLLPLAGSVLARELVNPD
jgi:hypothetical protein